MTSEVVVSVKSLALSFLLSVCDLSGAAASAPVPTTLDPDLSITLVASEPEIVTPIGAAVDARGRLFVIESHTHQVKPDYPGPKSDRVKVFTDTNGDGIPDRHSVFAEGFRHAMNLAFAPDGTMYLTHRNGVVILRDRDKDGTCESTNQIVRMETTGTYPHNGISGIAFGPDGWLYIGTGENLGEPYTLHGSDGSKWSGSGNDGAYVFRCRFDGSKLEQFARGGWNFFGLEIDGAGRLFAVDNDPDGRPPSRLLHIVRGGDYGYQFRYGRSGQHPYVCWNGELPGTLPMAAGTGEAPSAVLDARHMALGKRFRGGLLVTSWGDNEIEWFRLEPRGASFAATNEVVIRGGESFRPVALAAAPDGSVYVTDWADREYSVHQKGRIWRLATRNAAAKPKPTKQKLQPSEQRYHKLVNSSAASAYASLRDALADPDPFIRSAAITALTKPVFHGKLLRDGNHRSALVRQGVLLALRRGKAAVPESLLRAWLKDADPDVRQVALIWVGEEKLEALRPALAAAVSTEPVTRGVFKTYLATVDLLDREDAVTAYTAPAVQQLVLKILRDTNQPPSVQAMAIGSLSNPNSPNAAKIVLEKLVSRDLTVLTETIRTAVVLTNVEAATLLTAITLDRTLPTAVRADAVAAMNGQPPKHLMPLVPLLAESDNVLRRATVRTLRGGAVESPEILKALQNVRAALREGTDDRALIEQLDFTLNSGVSPRRPTTDAEWIQPLQAGGDPDEGRRIFFDIQLACAKCHIADGRGGDVGPDLSTIARSADRKRLIDSILEPSRDIGPLYVAKTVEMKDGESHSGVPLGIDAVETLTLKTADGNQLKLLRDEILSVRESSLSVMPDGLEQALTVQDFRDLLAYLLSLK